MTNLSLPKKAPVPPLKSSKHPLGDERSVVHLGTLNLEPLSHPLAKVLPVKAVQRHSLRPYPVHQRMPNHQLRLCSRDQRWSELLLEWSGYYRYPTFLTLCYL